MNNDRIGIPKIKICGLTCPEDIRAVNYSLPDFAGFVMFFSKSKRNITPEEASILLGQLTEEIASVAVVVSPSEEQIHIIESLGFQYVQIHGNLSDEVYQQVNIPIIRAVNVTSMEDISSAEKMEKIVGYVFDAKEPGSGKTFDWKLMKRMPADGKMILLAGGINEENVLDAIRMVRPDGIDLSSAVEWDDKEKKGKDPEKIDKIVRKVHYAE